ncbi:MAG: hypothetical protein IPL91_14905 [Hyphomicrobium sp.]|nr:hypothetical protein [Hyphomicrobium sp.]
MDRHKSAFRPGTREGNRPVKHELRLDVSERFGRAGRAVPAALPPTRPLGQPTRLGPSWIGRGTRSAATYLFHVAKLTLNNLAASRAVKMR